MQQGLHPGRVAIVTGALDTVDGGMSAGIGGALDREEDAAAIQRPYENLSAALGHRDPRGGG